MGANDRRGFMLAAGAALVTLARAGGAVAGERPAAHFIAEAERMRALAVASGDQSYGAVVVREGAIIGYGPSRVVVDRNLEAHAERVALWAAQRLIGRDNLAGAAIYSTSPPCADCQAALAVANVEVMFVGPVGADRGRPRAR